MKQRAPRQPSVCVCVPGRGGCVCGSCLDSPWVYEQRESGRSHKSSRRGAGFTLITIIRYFSLFHSRSPFFFFSFSPLWHNEQCRSRLIHERSLLCFFEEFDAQRKRRKVWKQAASVRLGLWFIKKASRGVLLFVSSCFVIFYLGGKFLIFFFFSKRGWTCLTH